jgi:hypothetical protein
MPRPNPRAPIHLSAAERAALVPEVDPELLEAILGALSPGLRDVFLWGASDGRLGPTPEELEAQGIVCSSTPGTTRWSDPRIQDLWDAARPLAPRSILRRTFAAHRAAGLPPICRGRIIRTYNLEHVAQAVDRAVASFLEHGELREPDRQHLEEAELAIASLLPTLRAETATFFRRANTLATMTLKAAARCPPAA